MTFPELRQDLALYPAPPTEDGISTWHLHDPAANRYYLLGWPAFEILSRWSLGDVQAIAEAVSEQTTLAVAADDVVALATFLDQHHLLSARTAKDSQRLAAAAKAQKLHWAKWLLHNYLFLKIPLVHPGPLLDRFARHMGIFLRKEFWWGVAALLVLGLTLVARQWDQFTHTFFAYQGMERIFSYGVALSVAKLCHEMGHALMARHHGCKVPTMGVAFLVLWPVLYTDTNEAWKLPSRRARFQIGIAGIAAEMVLAVLATLAWVFLPEGTPRAAAFFLATSSWVMTLGINVSPFMRFDGYFLLSDAMGIANLHSRAFAFGRWWLREKLFGLGAAAPENLPRARQRFLIAFAIATWIYRLTLFLSIALLVYHAFFKALGILLLLVEVGWFVALPMFRETQAWWKGRKGITWNNATRRSAAAVFLILLLLVVPWQSDVPAPAVLAPALEQSLFAPAPAQIQEEAGKDKREVRKGEILLRLNSPELDHRLKLALIEEEAWRWQVQQQTFHGDLMMQGDALRRHWEEAQAMVSGLGEQVEQLEVRAPFDGEILQRNQELAPGTWVTPRDLLYAIADRRKTRVDAYVGEGDLERLRAGASAKFLPNAPEFGSMRCIIGDIDRTNVTELQEPSLASSYGGPLAVHTTARGTLVPAASVIRVRLTQCEPAQAPNLRLRGTAHLDAEGRSYLLVWWRAALRALIREGGF